MARKSFSSDFGLYDRYYAWLLDEILYSEMKKKGRDYTKLLEFLRRYDFVWSIPNDINRAEDGKYLRITFRELTGIKGEIKGACSFLEMAIALATRITEDLFEHDPNSYPAHWFWIMMENCGLDRFTDDNFDELEVRKVVDRVQKRRFSKTGKGGFFPLKHPKQDQREVEMWYEMQNYIIENYGF